MREGQVAEEGTHASLLKSRGLYYNMWIEQGAETRTEDENVEDHVEIKA